MECVRLRRKVISHSVRICCIYRFSDKKCERAKDMHLVKKLAALLKTRPPNLGACPLAKIIMHTLTSFSKLITYFKCSNQNILVPL